MQYRGVALISQFHGRSHTSITFSVNIKHKTLLKCNFKSNLLGDVSLDLTK